MAAKNPFSGFILVHDTNRNGVFGPKDRWLNPAAIASITRIDPRENTLEIQMVDGTPPGQIRGDEASRILQLLGGKLA